MSRRSLLSSKPATATALLAAGVLVAGLATPLAQAGASVTASGSKITDTGPEVLSQDATGLPDLDTRGSVSPSSAQRNAVPSGASVRWNRYGTPSSLINRTGYLSPTHTASARTVARNWLSAHRAVLGLSSDEVSAMSVLADSRLVQSTAHVVRFREQYGDAMPAVDGMVSVAVDPRGRVTYVSSGLSRNTSAAPAATLSPLTAWSKAVADLRGQSAPAIPAAEVGGITTSQVDG